MVEIVEFPNAPQKPRRRAISFRIVSHDGENVGAIILNDAWTVKDANALLRGEYRVTAINQRSELVDKTYVD